jgi:hypothetical protein
MNQRRLEFFFLTLLAAVETVLTIHLSHLQESSYFSLKLLALWLVAVSFHFLGFTTLSRFSVAMTLTALISYFFISTGLQFVRLSMFNWAILFLLLIMILNWHESATILPETVTRSTLLLSIYLGIPLLILFQLNPLLKEVYAQPTTTSLVNFLTIPLGFVTFILVLNLKRNIHLFVALGIPLVIPIFQECLR